MRNKKQIVSAIAKECDYTVRDTQVFYDAFTKVIKKTLLSGEEFVIPGIVKFSIVKGKPTYKASFGKPKKLTVTRDRIKAKVLGIQTDFYNQWNAWRHEQIVAGTLFDNYDMSKFENDIKKEKVE